MINNEICGLKRIINMSHSSSLYCSMRYIQKKWRKKLVRYTIAISVIAFVWVLRIVFSCTSISITNFIASLQKFIEVKNYRIESVQASWDDFRLFVWKHRSNDNTVRYKCIAVPFFMPVCLLFALLAEIYYLHSIKLKIFENIFRWNYWIRRMNCWSMALEFYMESRE